MIDGLVIPHIGGDPKLLADWRNAKRIGKKLGPAAQPGNSAKPDSVAA